MSTLLRRYYRGASLVGLRDEVAASTRYYHFDHQGTTQCLTDPSGTVTDRFAADAWGVPVKRTGSSINRHWYVGNWGYYRQVDHVIDYVRARYLVAQCGAWSSRDPSRLEIHLYLYATGGPSVRIDPSGLQCGDFAGCYDNCNNPLPCSDPRCKWQNFVNESCRQAPGGSGGCQPKPCEPYKQRVDLLGRLEEVACQGKPIACMKQQPLQSPSGKPKPWAVTYCCPKGGKCVGYTYCVDCFPAGQGQNYSEQPGCVQDCLWVHEKEHGQQCVTEVMRFSCLEVLQSAC